MNQVDLIQIDSTGEHPVNKVLVGLPWGFPWVSRSQQASWGGSRHGRWRCVGRRAAGEPWSSSLGPSCAVDPGDGRTPAVLQAGPVTSWPVEVENSGDACSGHAEPVEHWRPKPTQEQREEGVKNLLASSKSSWWVSSKTYIVAVIEAESSHRFLHWGYVIVLYVSWRCKHAKSDVTNSRVSEKRR